jgi:Mrp family chromosome partitioning ATPase
VKTSLEDRLQALRLIIETDIGASGLIFVTAATAEDAPGSLATSIAHAIAAEGRRTALLRLHASGQTDLEYKVARGRRPDVIPLQARGAGDGEPRVSTERRLLEMRTRYEYCIIDGGVGATTSTALEAARLADGVIIAVSLNRLAVATDLELVPKLARINARFIGAVAVDVPLLDEYVESLKTDGAWKHWIEASELEVVREDVAGGRRDDADKIASL